MKILFTRGDTNVYCPLHGCDMVLEDSDPLYGHSIYVCQYLDCEEVVKAGESERDRLMREYGYYDSPNARA